MKSRPAELDAWTRRSTTVTSRATPLFEIAFEPTKTRPTIDDYLEGLSPTLATAVGSGNTVIIDGGTIDQTVPAAHTSDRFIHWMSDDLGLSGITYVPVVRLDDLSIVLRDAGSAARAHGGGVVLRLGKETTYPDLASFPTAFAQLLKRTGLSVGDIHVLLDYQAVQSPGDVAAVVANANPWLIHLAAAGPFASVHIASGAFPATISTLKVATDNRLRRHDADVYTSLTIPHGLDVGFSDFLVNHPSTAGSVKRQPLPGLRYTAGGEWLVWREKRTRPGNESFYTVCENVAASTAFAGATYSWGDRQVASRAATPVAKGVGPGGAKEWRTYGSVHHVQVVVDRLTTLGAP